MVKGLALLGGVGFGSPIVRFGAMVCRVGFALRRSDQVVRLRTFFVAGASPGGTNTFKKLRCPGLRSKAFLSGFVCQLKEHSDGRLV